MIRTIFPATLALLIITSASLAADAIRFTEVTRQAGLLEPLAGMMGHGGAWGDVDGDGDLDLYVGGFCDRPDEEYAPAGGPVPNHLFLQGDDGTFGLVEGSPANFYGRTSGAVFADLDNDGALELYAANNSKGRTRKEQEPQRSAQVRPSDLFRNDGGKLVSISEKSGACPESLHTARNIGVFDYNADGQLDLFVVEDVFTRSPRSVLFENLGGLRFKDVNAEVGLPDDLYGLGLAVADLNEDGQADFFVPHSNRLFLSRPGHKYREATELEPVFAWDPLDNEDWPCGAAFSDLNRDGRLDLVLSIHSERARNKVFVNGGLKGGVPQFRDVTDQVGLGVTVPQKCPHVEIQDFDNDGWPDIYMSAAWLDDEGNVTPLVYRNLGLKGGLPRFEPPRPVAEPMVYYPAGPSADYDRDGKIDLLLINWFQENHTRLLRNDSPGSGHWLNVKVAGDAMNRMGIGAQVKVYPAGKLGRPAALLGFQEMTTGYGYASGQETVCHFGLGDAARVDLHVKLPGGKVIRREGVEADQTLVIAQ